MINLHVACCGSVGFSMDLPFNMAAMVAMLLFLIKWLLTENV